ncbi:tail fiber domain-containing protein, partial [Serratia marcescens]
TDPTLEVGGAMFYADGNVSGSKWANQGGGQWNNYLSNWLGANGVSDQRYKENIKPTTRVALDTVDKIQFVDFDWSENMRGQKNTDSVTGGWISQELEKIDPSLVNHLFDGEFVNPDISTVLPLAFKAIQELSEKNKALEERLQKLEELMNK